MIGSGGIVSTIKPSFPHIPSGGSKTIKPINGKEGYFRITPGTPEECERFMAFIEAYF